MRRSMKYGSDLQQLSAERESMPVKRRLVPQAETSRRGAGRCAETETRIFPFVHSSMLHRNALFPSISLATFRPSKVYGIRLGSSSRSEGHHRFKGVSRLRDARFIQDGYTDWHRVWASAPEVQGGSLSSGRCLVGGRQSFCAGVCRKEPGQEVEKVRNVEEGRYGLSGWQRQLLRCCTSLIKPRPLHAARFLRRAKRRQDISDHKVSHLLAP